MYWLMAYQWLYTAMMLLALIASLRYARLSKSSPLLSGGVGLLLASNLLSKVTSTFGWNLLHVFPILPNSTVIHSFPQFYIIISVLGIFGWALVAYGIHAVMAEVSQRLALLQLAPQHEWNYQSAPHSLQNQFVQGQHIPQDSQFSPVLSQQPSQQHDNGSELLQEETHAPAFVSPFATAPPASVYSTVAAVQSEQPDAALTLGSTRQ